MRKLIFVFLPFFVFAQKLELGNVTIEELKEKLFVNDTSAVAKIMIDIGKVTFEYTQNNGFEMVLEVEEKIKIYKKEGFEYATISRSYQNDESVSFSKAYTYNLVNGKIEKTKLNNDGEFKEKISENLMLKKIVLPNVKEGSIIEYKYVYRTPYYQSLVPWKFQSLIPVEFSQLKTIIPEYYSFKHYKRGLKEIINTSSSENSSLIIDSKKYDYNSSISIFTMKDISAFKIEPYSNNIENYLSGIDFELASTQFPNKFPKYYSLSWEDVTSNIYKSNYFGDEIKKENYFEQDLNTLLSKKYADNNEKIYSILEFVKSKVKWNNSQGIYTDKGVKTAYKNGIGNSTEINFILIAMLRKSGFQANPILISTRNKPLNLFPSVTAFNKVICGIEVENDVILLDATRKYTTLNVLPINDLNYYGRIIRTSGSSAEISLNPNKYSICNYQGLLKIDSSGKIDGGFRKTSTDYLGYLRRDKIDTMNDEQYYDFLEKENKGIEVNDTKIENKNDLNKSFVEQFNFSSTNFVEIVGNKLLLKPFLFESIEENPFKQEKREYLVDFIFPIKENYQFTYNFPEGYIFESKPEDIFIEAEDKTLSFRMTSTVNGNTFQFSSTFAINSTIILPESYLILKKFYNTVISKMSERLVLKKQ